MVHGVYWASLPCCLTGDLMVPFHWCRWWQIGVKLATADVAWLEPVDVQMGNVAICYGNGVDRLIGTARLHNTIQPSGLKYFVIVKHSLGQLMEPY